MGRRGLGLLAALALLVVPAAATTAEPRAEADGRSPVRAAVPDGHATVAHVVARTTSGRERRSSHHSSASPAVPCGASGVAPGATGADLVAATGSAPGDLPSSSRPRAPPAVSPSAPT